MDFTHFDRVYNLNNDLVLPPIAGVSDQITYGRDGVDEVSGVELMIARQKALAHIAKLQLGVRNIEALLSV